MRPQRSQDWPRRRNLAHACRDVERPTTERHLCASIVRYGTVEIAVAIPDRVSPAAVIQAGLIHEALHRLRRRHEPTRQSLHRACPPVEPQPPQRPLQHAGLAAPQHASAPSMARSARLRLPWLRARSSPGTGPDRRSRRAARSRWRALRHRQLRGALPVLQLDEGCVRARPGGTSRPEGHQERPRLPFVCARTSFAISVTSPGSTGLTDG